MTLFNHLIKLLYQLNNTILQYIQHPNFYFPILLIKIIFLHNKIIYLKIIIIYNTIHYLFSLSFLLFKNDHKFTKTTIITSPPPLHYTHLTPPLLHYTYLTPPPPPPPPATHNLPSTSKKKKKKWRDYSINPPLTQSTPNAATHGPHHCEQNPNPRWQTHVVAANQAD